MIIAILLAIGVVASFVTAGPAGAAGLGAGIIVTLPILLLVIYTGAELWGGPQYYVLVWVGLALIACLGLGAARRLRGPRLGDRNA